VSFDDHLRDALNRVSDELKRAAAEERHRAAEAAVADVRRQAEAQLAEIQESARRRVEELQRSAADDRERAVAEGAAAAAAEVRRQADAQIAQLHETAQREAYEIRHAASEERELAVKQAAEAAASDVRREAEAQIAQVHEAAQAQAEEIKRAAEAQTSDLRRALETQLEEVRRTAHSESEEARRAARAEADEARRLAAVQAEGVQRTFEEQLAGTRRELETQIQDVQGRSKEEIERARAELAAARVEAEKMIGEAVDRTRTDAHQAGLAQAALLVEGVRTLDDARSLVETLDALAESAAAQVERAAVLVVKPDGATGGTLRGWRLSGFGDDTLAKGIELDLDAAGLAGAVVRTGVSVSRPAVEPGDEQGTRQPALPPFAQDVGGRHAMALPLIVGGRVVAVLYGDAPRSETPSAAALWPAALEVLARHASRALEVTTVQRAAGLTVPRSAPRAAQATLPGPIEQGGTGEEDAARRYARLLVSEIRMYHEPLVDEGRRSRDLRLRLGGEIDRARRLYEARVPPAVRERSDYFEQELVRTLAGGDRSLLG
jgi:hypothetical protein